MKRILIVDDAIDLGRLLQDALKTVHPDIPISVVPSAEEALLESTRFTIDVLVADIRLPGMSGLDLVRKIRVRQPNVKVILMTGLRPDDHLFKQKDEASPDIFLRKPIMPPDFLSAVDQLLGETGSAPSAAPAAVPAAPAKEKAADKPAADRPAVERPAAERRAAVQLEPERPVISYKAAAERPADRPVERPERSSSSKGKVLADAVPATDLPFMRPAALKPAEEKPAAEKPAPPKPVVEKPAPEKQAPPPPPASKDEQEALRAAVLKELAAVMPGEAVEPAPKPQARKMTGMLKLGAEPAKSVQDEGGLSAVLSRLRSSLGATTTMLLDERGRPVAQAGDLPELQVEELLAAPLLASLSASAKISYMLGQSTTQLVQAYRGNVLDLVAAPVGQYVLLMWLPCGRSALRLALAFEEAINAQSEISAALEAMGLRLLTSVETGAPELLSELGRAAAEAEEAVPLEMMETPLGQDPGLEKFEELFSLTASGKAPVPDLDSFWDQAGTEGKEIEQSGVLTFEQAQKLGLFPPSANG